LGGTGTTEKARNDYRKGGWLGTHIPKKSNANPGRSNRGTRVSHRRKTVVGQKASRKNQGKKIRTAILSTTCREKNQGGLRNNVGQGRREPCAEVGIRNLKAGKGRKRTRGI